MAVEKCSKDMNGPLLWSAIRPSTVAFTALLWDILKDCKVMAQRNQLLYDSVRSIQ